MATVLASAARRSIAYRLAGVELDGGWIVAERLAVREDDLSGGLSSVQYTVQRGAERAFLKVLDLAAAPAHETESSLNTASRLIQAFAFEVSLLKACSGKDRIVRYVDDGRHLPMPEEPSFFVPYVIIELADGDVRDYLRDQSPDVAWCLEAAHNITVGLSQMHHAGIFHQDLKASNALYFKHVGCKIGDMGSACSGVSELNRYEGFVGSWLYAPPELWYGVAVDDYVRRAGDLFLLGSLIIYMLTQVSMRALILEAHLPTLHRPRVAGGSWSGTYENVLPYVQHAFSMALADVRAQLPLVPGTYDYRDELMDLIHALCDPDYRARGFKQHDGSITLDLEKAITALNRMAKRVGRARPRS